MSDSREANRADLDEPVTRRANRGEWDRYADEYQLTHGEFLGDAGFVWGPEGWREADLGALGELPGRRVLEVGCGAAQCTRWVQDQGAEAVGLDISARQLQHARRIDDELGRRTHVVLGTGTHLPFKNRSFDVVFSSFGALQFVADYELAVAEAARVLRPGGRFAFSVTHPLRWAFLDDPGPEGLTAASSYWDRRAYVERDPETDRITYVEHHRTIGDWVIALARAGFVLVDLMEPEWPEGHERIWGGWSSLRGRLMPGTAIFVADLAAPPSPVARPLR